MLNIRQSTQLVIHYFRIELITLVAEDILDHTPKIFLIFLSQCLILILLIPIEIFRQFSVLGYYVILYCLFKHLVPQGLAVLVIVL